jgi:hypothetical protein
VHFNDLFHSGSFELILRTSDSSENGSIFLSWRTWSLEKFLLLVSQITSAWTSSGRPSCISTKDSETTNWNEHCFILINDFITRIHTSQNSLPTYDVLSLCRGRAIVLTMLQLNHSSDIWKMRLISRNVKIYKKLKNT